MRLLDELGGPCDYCIHYQKCKREQLACGAFVTYALRQDAPSWAKRERGRNPTDRGYIAVFHGNAE